MKKKVYGLLIIFLLSVTSLCYMQTSSKQIEKKNSVYVPTNSFTPRSLFFINNKEKKKNSCALAVGFNNNNVFIRKISGPLKEENTFSSHEAPITYVSLSNNGSMVASGDETGRVIIWNVETGKTIRDIDPDKYKGQKVKMLLFSPDNTKVAVVYDARYVSIFSIYSDKFYKNFKLGTSIAIAFSPDGNYLFSIEIDYEKENGTIFCYPLNFNNMKITIPKNYNSPCQPGNACFYFGFNNEDSSKQLLVMANPAYDLFGNKAEKCLGTVTVEINLSDTENWFKTNFSSFGIKKQNNMRAKGFSIFDFSWAKGEDESEKTTCMTFLDNGKKYIETSINGCIALGENDELLAGIVLQKGIPITCMNRDISNQYLAIGLENGDTYIIDLEILIKRLKIVPIDIVDATSRWRNDYRENIKKLLIAPQNKYKDIKIFFKNTGP